MHIAAAGTAMFSLFVPLSALSGQVRQSQLQHGQRIRIETCTPVCEWRHEGLLLEWTPDTVTIAEREATVSVPQSAVETVEVEIHHDFEGANAVWGAGIGAVAFAALAQASGARVGANDRSLALPGAAIGAGMGALFGGGGRSARHGAGVGLAIGAGIGAIAGAMFCSTTTGFASCAAEAGAGFGALAGGGIGAAIGVAVGALNRHSWQCISSDRVRVQPVATPDGFGLAASARF